MIQRFLLSVALAASIIGTGCEWTSSSGGGSYNESYGWVDFSGVYRSPNGGPIVRGMTVTPGDEAELKLETDIYPEETVEGQKRYNGLLTNHPINPGSLSITVDSGSQQLSSFSFSDNGDGTLSEVSGDGNGTIVYDTGKWIVHCSKAVHTGGGDIRASYSYMAGGTDDINNPGNTGAQIYSLTVNQSGNRLAITDSQGRAFSGQVTGTSGTSDPETPGNVRLVYDVANGDGSIRMNGSFSGDWSGSTMERSGTLSNRRIEGTWIERRVQGDISGVSGSVSLSPNLMVSP